MKISSRDSTVKIDNHLVYETQDGPFKLACEACKVSLRWLLSVWVKKLTDTRSCMLIRAV